MVEDDTQSEAAEADRPLLVFIHIPKTAGSTVRSVLQRQMPVGYRLHTGNMFKGRGGFTDQPLEAIEAGLGPAGTADDVSGLSGHVPFAVSARIARPATYFTFMRDPVERVLSHYFYLRQGGKQTSRPWSIDPAITLVDAVTRPELELIYDNLQTRMLSNESSPYVPATREMLAAAKENLDRRFAAVGVAERFDESLVLLRLRLGWKAVLYRRRRVNEARPGQSTLASEEMDAIMRHNELDRELYEYAVQRLDREIDLLGSRFQIELAAFERAQRAYETGAAPPSPAAELTVGGARTELMEAEMEMLRFRVLYRNAQAEADQLSKDLAVTRYERDRAVQRSGKAAGRVAKLELRLERSEARLAKAQRRLDPGGEESSAAGDTLAK